MERLFRVKDDNRILILNADEIIEKEGKPFVMMRNIVETSIKLDDETIISEPLISVEYKEVEEVQIFESDDGSYVISKKV